MEKPKVMLLRFGPRQSALPMAIQLPQETQGWSGLREMGAMLGAAHCRTEDELIDAAADADLVICSSDTPVSRRLLEHLPRCRGVVRAAVGVDNIDLVAATELGIVVANVPDFCIEEVSNHAIMLLLACAKKLVVLHGAFATNRWDRSLLPPMGTIHGQTLALIGYGRLARATGRKAKAFGLRVIAYDPYVDKADARETGVELFRGDLHRVVAQSDYVSLHTPLTEETRHLIGEPELRAMNRSAYLINTSRGAVVDERALIRALQEGWIAGAGLDVFEKEPPDPDSPLLRMPNVTATIHCASYSDAAMAELWQRAGDEAARILSGRWPLCVANPGVRARGW